MQPEDKLLQHHGYELCPFYNWKGRKIKKTDSEDDVARKIFCEGVIPDTGIVHYFNNKAERDVHMNTFCRNRFDCCEYYMSLMDIKYGRDIITPNMEDRIPCGDKHVCCEYYVALMAIRDGDTKDGE